MADEATGRHPVDGRDTDTTTVQLLVVVEEVKQQDALTQDSSGGEGKCNHLHAPTAQHATATMESNQDTSSLICRQLSEFETGDEIENIIKTKETPTELDQGKSLRLEQPQKKEARKLLPFSHNKTQGPKEAAVRTESTTNLDRGTSRGLELPQKKGSWARQLVNRGLAELSQDKREQLARAASEMTTIRHPTLSSELLEHVERLQPQHSMHAFEIIEEKKKAAGMQEEAVPPPVAAAPSPSAIVSRVAAPTSKLAGDNDKTHRVATNQTGDPSEGLANSISVDTTIETRDCGERRKIESDPSAKPQQISTMSSPSLEQPRSSAIDALYNGPEPIPETVEILPGAMRIGGRESDGQNSMSTFLRRMSNELKFRSSELIQAVRVSEDVEAIVIASDRNTTENDNTTTGSTSMEPKPKRLSKVWLVGIALLALALAVGLAVGLTNTPPQPLNNAPGKTVPPITETVTHTRAPIVERTLQIIHTNENQSGLQDINTLEEKVLHYSSIIEGLRMLPFPASIHVATGDLTLPGPFFEASSEVEFLGSSGAGDIEMFNAMGWDVTGIGNHEFDSGLAGFATLLAASNFPYLSVNLDFGAAQLPEGTPPIVGSLDASPCREVAGRVAKSCFLETPIGQVGLIGRSPTDLFLLIDDAEAKLPGIDFVGGRDIDTNLPFLSSSGLIRQQVQLLESKAIDIIILLDQEFDNFNRIGEPVLTEDLKGIDIVIGEVWANRIIFAQLNSFGPFNLLRQEDEADVNYPVVRLDSSSHRVLFVNSAGLYRYVGNLIVTFDEDGFIASWDGRSGPIATTQEAVDWLGDVVGADLEPTDLVSATFQQLQTTPSIQDSFAVVGSTFSPLEGSRSEIRTRETNLGRLIADSTLWAGSKYAEANGLLPVDIGFKNSGGTRDSIIGPAITRISIRNCLAFNNEIALVELTVGQLIAALEHAVSAFPVHDGRFPHVAGLSLIVNASRPAIERSAFVKVPSRIQSVVLEGRRNGGLDDIVLVDGYQLLENNRTYLVATNSFVAAGGDGYVAFGGAVTIRETGVGTEQEILEDYIQEHVPGTLVNISDPPPDPALQVLSES